MTDNQTLTFRVRAGLAVHRERSTTEHRGRQTIRRAERVSFGEAFGNELVELRSDEVRKHAHALEPFPVSEGDPSSTERHKASAAALAELHHRPPERAEAGTGLEERVAAAAVAAVFKALISAGALPVPKK